MITELNEERVNEAAKLLQAVAHPKRLLLLTVLSDRQLSARRLAAAVGLPPGMVCRHLYKLVGIGMLTVSAKAADIRFSIASPEIAHKLMEIRAALAAQLSGNAT